MRLTPFALCGGEFACREIDVMNGQYRKDIYPGLSVAIVLKKDQRSGTLTHGVVKDLLTSAPYHSRGIKVRLQDGQVGRVHQIINTTMTEGPRS